MGAGARELRVEVEPWGPDAAALQAVSQRVLAHPSVQEQLHGAQHRLLGLALVDPDPEVKRAPSPAA
jgi:hypothetical protein